MRRCQHCGKEVEEGRDLCPHCGEAPLAAAGAAPPSPVSEAVSAERRDEPPPAVPMSSFEQRKEEPDGSRRTVFIAVAVVGALLLGGLAWLASRPSTAPGEERLEGAVRPGSPEFPAPDRLLVEFVPDEHAEIGPTAIGPWAVTMRPVVRNFTGRTVNGLEFRAAGLDLSGRVIRERTYVTQQEIEPNKVHTPAISVQFPADNKPADLKLELTGVRFK